MTDKKKITDFTQRAIIADKIFYSGHNVKQIHIAFPGNEMSIKSIIFSGKMRAVLLKTSV